MATSIDMTPRRREGTSVYVVVWSRKAAHEFHHRVEDLCVAFLSQVSTNSGRNCSPLQANCLRAALHQGQSPHTLTVGMDLHQCFASALGVV
jgi:hypothetical protein